MTVLLALTVFLLLVAETLPTQSDSVPLLGLYLQYSNYQCLLFICGDSVTHPSCFYHDSCNICAKHRSFSTNNIRVCSSQIYAFIVYTNNYTKWSRSEFSAYLSSWTFNLNTIWNEIYIQCYLNIASNRRHGFRDLLHDIKTLLRWKASFWRTICI